MKYILLFFLPLVLMSCHNNTNNETGNTSADSTIGKKNEGYNVKQLAGLFFDTLPCADCPGIATQIYLKPDMAFIMESEYIGKNVSYQTGTWSFSDSLLRLTGKDDVQQFKIMSYEELAMLDAQGKEIIGAPASMHFHRNNIPFKPLKPVPVEGIYRAVNDTMTIHICSLNKDYPATLAPTGMVMAAKYQRAVQQPGQSIFAKVAGHFELRPSLNDTTTQDFFVIEKFISFDAKGVCH